VDIPVLPRCLRSLELLPEKPELTFMRVRAQAAHAVSERLILRCDGLSELDQFGHEGALPPHQIIPHLLRR